MTNISSIYLLYLLFIIFIVFIIITIIKIKIKLLKNFLYFAKIAYIIKNVYLKKKTLIF